jgi:predicted alpha/beta-hydrolase family hydrolase
VTVLKVDTPHGPARVHLHPARNLDGALVLGHGAAGGVTSGDLATATEVALEQGLTVALVEQPYRVAGRRSPAPARQLDAAWIAVLDHLRAGELSRGRRPVAGRARGVPHR